MRMINYFRKEFISPKNFRFRPVPHRKAMVRCNSTQHLSVQAALRCLDVP